MHRSSRVFLGRLELCLGLLELC